MENHPDGTERRPSLEAQIMGCCPSPGVRQAGPRAGWRWVDGKEEGVSVSAGENFEVAGVDV